MRNEGEPQAAHKKGAVVPLPGLTLSQAALDVAVTPAEPGETDIAMLFSAGAAPPIWQEFANEAGAAASVGNSGAERGT
jgi:hypothetical protein